ncbi:histidine phosphatase family protein [Pseudonocardia dioxanivorans]|uniref:histidine phosphatase family protein n=1 Tax=Pseudonocardia dioxanivorans TaxID=240495 RepID=UPI000CD08B4C|nr:histidine phosphatase family protein [Pseudonocardia dioxanivorans]
MSAAAPASARLTLVTHASTAATAAAAFAADEPLEPRGAAAAGAARGALSRVTAAMCSPAQACVATAAALGLAARPADVWRDWDLGRWRGSTLDEVAAAEPAAVGTWLADPDAAPHDGESLTALAARVAATLADPGLVPAEGRAAHLVVVTHAAVVRAVVLAVLGAPATGFWRLDAAPLTATVLRGVPGRWTVRATATPLVPPPRG